MRLKSTLFLTVVAFFHLVSLPLAIGQIPTGTPRTDEPFRIQTTADIIIYVALPILIIILFVFWWKFYKKPKEEEAKRKKEEEQNKG